MYFRASPVFPFGHGLSYTRFDYAGLKLSSPVMPEAGSVRVAVDVKNSGARAGDEVVQLYFHQRQCSVKQAIKKLGGFRRVHLEPGETQTVELELKADQLAFYDVRTKTFLVEPGAFDVMVGSSSADVRAKDELTVPQALHFKP